MAAKRKTKKPATVPAEDGVPPPVLDAETYASAAASAGSAHTDRVDALSDDAAKLRGSSDDWRDAMAHRIGLLGDEAAAVARALPETEPTRDCPGLLDDAPLGESSSDVASVAATAAARFRYTLDVPNPLGSWDRPRIAHDLLYLIARNEDAPLKWRQEAAQALKVLVKDYEAPKGKRWDTKTIDLRDAVGLSRDWDVLASAPLAPEEEAGEAATGSGGAQSAPRVFLGKSAEQVHSYLFKAWAKEKRPTYDDAMDEGWTRKTYSKALKKLESHGLIERRKRRIVRVFPREVAR